MEYYNLMIILRYFFLFHHENLHCGYSLDTFCQGTSNKYKQHNVFMQKYEKHQHFFFAQKKIFHM